MARESGPTLAENDSRHLYTTAAGWPIVPENDFNITPNARAFPVNARQGETAGDYSQFLSQQKKPVVSHEIGQYCVFPNLEETTKYKGWLKAENFEIVRDFLKQHGMENQAKDFLRASGKLQALFYKDEIEACLRTAGWGGFQLLDLHDFPGQGTALVGVLDPFWNEKGYIKASEYRRFCDDTVPLARLSKRIWTSDETWKAAISVAPLWPAEPRKQGRTLAHSRFIKQNVRRRQSGIQNPRNRVAQHPGSNRILFGSI